ALYQVDFSRRLIERNTLNAFHGVHVMGTSAGAGIVNELYRGYAPKATIVNASQAAIFSPLYVKDHHMVLTNNSYGRDGTCQFNGTYLAPAQAMDIMAFDFPHLLNVFAAGNDGETVCAPYPV